MQDIPINSFISLEDFKISLAIPVLTYSNCSGGIEERNSSKSGIFIAFTSTHIIPYVKVIVNVKANETKQSAAPTERKVIIVMTKNARQMLMGDIEMTPDIFLESKDMRDKCISRIELLDKVKQLFLLPELECLTTKQMADYFEVGYEAIKHQYKANQKEFDDDGTTTKSPAAFKILNGLAKTVKNMAQQNGKLVITLADNTELIIPNRGIKCFPKRAILRMGMLLQGSRVSQEIRTQLLNTFERATVEQRTQTLDEEEYILLDMMRAYKKHDITGVLAAANKQDEMNKRYINSLRQENTNLEKENEKVTSDNKALTAANDIYAKDVLKWADRASANRAVRVMANMFFGGRFEYAWNTIYKELAYKYGIVVKARAALDTRKRSLLSYIKDNEWVYVFREIAALCNQNKGNIKKLFADAKIDISNIDSADMQLANTSA